VLFPGAGRRGSAPRRVGAAPEVDRILVTLGQDLSVYLRTQCLEKFVGRKVQNLILSLLLVRSFFGWYEDLLRPPTPSRTDAKKLLSLNQFHMRESLP